MSRHYRIHEFAKLAGVTVKALHHYDRLGLLRPGRTQSGYRIYLDRHLETLEQIVALKFLGIPLKQIGVVLKRATQLPEALQLQRRALQHKHDLLGRAIRAIQAAEESLEPGQPADAAILRKIIQVIDMQDGIAVMRKYYSDAAWERHKRYYEEGPAPEWRQLYRDAEALLGTDPESRAAQALVPRWLELSRRAHIGDPALATDSPEAWIDRQHWPPAMKQRMAEFKIEEVTGFIKVAALAQRRHSLSEGAWARLMKLQQGGVEKHSRLWKARADLFHDLETALSQDPAGEVAQSLVSRWNAQLDDAAEGDAEIRAGLVHGWSNRRHWPETMHWQVERVHLMNYERFQKAADFLDRAIAAGTPGKILKEKPMTNAGDPGLLAEFEEEMANTRKMLERVPEDRLGWRPDEKSSTLAKLASHIARMPMLPLLLLQMKLGPALEDAASRAQLLERFDANVAAGREALAGADAESLARVIPVTPGVYKPLMYVIRSRVMNHMIHHRGQLSVYLRLLGVAVPGMYGPSADEKA